MAYNSNNYKLIEKREAGGLWLLILTENVFVRTAKTIKQILILEKSKKDKKKKVCIGCSKPIYK